MRGTKAKAIRKYVRLLLAGHDDIPKVAYQQKKHSRLVYEFGKTKTLEFLEIRMQTRCERNYIKAYKNAYKAGKKLGITLRTPV